MPDFDECTFGEDFGLVDGCDSCSSYEACRTASGAVETEPANQDTIEPELESFDIENRRHEDHQIINEHIAENFPVQALLSNFYDTPPVLNTFGINIDRNSENFNFDFAGLVSRTIESNFEPVQDVTPFAHQLNNVRSISTPTTEEIMESLRRFNPSRRRSAAVHPYLDLVKDCLEEGALTEIELVGRVLREGFPGTTTTVISRFLRDALRGRKSELLGKDIITLRDGRLIFSNVCPYEGKFGEDYNSFQSCLTCEVVLSCMEFAVDEDIRNADIQNEDTNVDDE